MTAPLLQQTLPSDNSTGVSVSANLGFGFNQAVKAGSGFISIYKADGTLFHSIAITDTSQVTFSTTQVGRVIINPNVDLAAGTSHYVLVDTGAIENAGGEDFAGISSSTTLNFSTSGSAPGDTIAPLVNTTSPADNATGVAVGSNLVLTFNEAVKAGTGNIEIRKVSDGTIAKTIAVTDTTQVSFSGSQLTINPTTDLAAGTGYYVTFASGVVRDLANNNFAGISSTTAFNFTTSATDTTAPLLTATLPADNATNVSLSANLVLTFDEPVTIGSGWIEIRKSSDGSLVKNIAINDATQVAFAGNQITINPTNDLDLGTGYYVTVSFGAVVDLASNQFAGISLATPFNFTTTSAPPALPLAKTGPEFLANTATEGQQHNPTVAALTDGRFVIVWRDFSSNPDDPNGATRGQIFNAAGNKVGSEFLINTTTTGIQSSPIVTGLSDGRFVVTWTNINGGSLDVCAQLFAADGSKSGGEFLVTTTSGQQLDSIITELADGRFVIAWTEASGTGGDVSGYGVRAQIFDADGNKLGGDFLVNTTTSGSQYYPAIAALASGGFIVAWTDQSSSSARAQIYDEDGGKVGTELVVASSSAQDGPAVIGLANGNFVVLWKVLGGTTASMYGQVFDAGGSSVGTSFLVSNAVNSDAGTPRPYFVDTLDDGRFVVTWTHWTGTSEDVHSQVFNPNGTKSGEEFLVNTTVAGAQLWPALSVLADGNVAVAWTEMTQAGEIDVRGQLFEIVQGLVLTGNSLSNTLVGGVGDDTISGLGRGDVLTGNEGSDRFVYNAVSESTSKNHDRVTDFNASSDLFDLWFGVTGVDTSIASGSLGTRRFDSDLASAVSAAKLGAHHAVLFTPSAGTLAGNTFLIVDANAVAGYQASADLVVLLGSASNLTGLTAADFI